MYGTEFGAPPDAFIPGILTGPKVSSEFNFNFKQFFLGPKVSYEFDYYVIGARINLIDYTDFKQSDFRFTPEIGLTFVSYLNLFYGYNVPLSSGETRFAGTNRITLTININANREH